MEKKGASICMWLVQIWRVKEYGVCFFLRRGIVCGLSLALGRPAADLDEAISEAFAIFNATTMLRSSRSTPMEKDLMMTFFSILRCNV
jgi:hypothetical protein